MSGDNLHGEQPIRFYTEELTETKKALLEILKEEEDKPTCQ